ncbi:rhodanese-like domain-containing protein [Pseudomonas sp. SG20056]|uniref:rhodanese-like domain-containing protein n=1 Tax=Pseudomonas sp. SG20056 TaxID=3074146 RepID=UPI00287F406D|nr:rhodanese-like domain-containing protein [Pseudomonas sp. SG20056]WNF45190.1 rhodanese-like domain-containing protein [Pseudomonas sp. SG20056]
MRTLFATLSLLVSLPLLAGEAELSAAVVALQSPESVLIDVRTADEFAAGALPGAEQIEHEQIASRISAIAPDKDTPIVLYCRSGRRSSIAEESLRAMGYSNLINAGGYDELKLALESQD